MSERANDPESSVMDVADVVAWEKAIAASGTPLAELMVRAGQAVASYANDLLFEDDPLQPFNDKLVIPSVVDARKTAKMCGSGNNGGDGWVAAQELGDQGYSVTLVSKVSAGELTAEPARTNAIKADASSEFEVVIDPGAKELATLLASANLIIDAILGTGFAHDAVREPYNEWIQLANASRESSATDASREGGAADAACEDTAVNEAREDLAVRAPSSRAIDESDQMDEALDRRNTKILAVDCPSGLNAQTGEPASDCIKADLTVTMLAIKTGLIQPTAASFTGGLELADLDVPN